ncbi:MAG: hypothetical protein EOO15_17395, partial [Chitinophagaceae bacterium]
MQATPFLVLVASLLLACSKSVVAERPSVAVPAPVAPAPAVPLRTVHVSNATELKAALLDARAGDAIVLADGVYAGRFVVAAGRDGNATRPVVLRGGRGAILDAGSIQTGYVLHLQSSWWEIRGITIRNGLKGIIGDGVQHCLIDSVKVEGIGDEGIHLRAFSSHNTISRCAITNTGLKTPDYGEGIYLGSAKSNWSSYTNGLPDRSDSNQVLNNEIGPGVRAECIDIKEGSTGGLVRGNVFYSEGISGANAADSWIDLKGNYYRIENNTGHNPQGSVLLDGFQVHVAYAGWGNYNEFRGNQCNVNAAG